MPARDEKDGGFCAPFFQQFRLDLPHCGTRGQNGGEQLFVHAEKGAKFLGKLLFPNIEYACARRRSVIAPPRSRQLIAHEIPDEHQFLRDSVYVGAVRLYPEKLVDGIHSLRANSRYSENFFRILFKGVRLLFSAGIGIQHGREQKLVPFPKQREGFSQRRNRHRIERKIPVSLSKQRFRAFPDRFRVQIALFSPLSNAVVAAVGIKQRAAFVVDAALHSRRAYVESQETHQFASLSLWIRLYIT